MSTIEEQRNQAIAEQIRKMAGVEPAEIKTPAPIPPKERREKPQETPSSTVDFETYLKTFFSPCIIENRVSFSLNRDTLDLLRHILYDLRGKTTLSAYVENILREHISRNKELIGKAIEKNRRKPLIP